MKSNMFLTSFAAIFASVASASAIEYHPFIGATMGFAGADYSNEAEDFAREKSIDLPEDFFSIGIEAGVRFGNHSQIYNGGITLSMDKTDGSKIRDKFTDASYGKLHSLVMSATYDNYIRLSGDKKSRIDMVLGAGLGSMNYVYDFKELPNETVYSPLFAFKAGLDFELTNHITLSATGRLFVPTRSHYDMDTHYILGGAIKYLF